jgi:hypothetical protein
MPSLPKECGELMRSLISRCWSVNPYARPSFDEILQEFIAVNFAILPEADPSVVQRCVRGVLAWEADCPPSPPGHNAALRDSEKGAPFGGGSDSSSPFAFIPMVHSDIGQAVNRHEISVTREAEIVGALHCAVCSPRRQEYGRSPSNRRGGDSAFYAIGLRYDEFGLRESGFPEFVLGQSNSFQYCCAIRPVGVQPMLADYLVDPIPPQWNREIGSGGFSRVVLGENPQTGRTVAIKCIFEHFEKNVLFREVECLVQLNHPCVIRIVSFADRSRTIGAQIHLELAEHGSLRDVLRRIAGKRVPQFWTPTGMAIIICDIVLGMRYIHSRSVVHRDLKPSNILVTRSGRALIGDFGTSRVGNDPGTVTTPGATIQYAAPEMFVEGELTPKVDIFSFGLVLYEILTNSAVFSSSMLPVPVMKCLFAGKMPPIPPECGELMQSLISRCWLKDPGLRPSFDDILKEFQAAHFMILPNVEADIVGSVAMGVLDWEAQFS